MFLTPAREEFDLSPDQATAWDAITRRLADNGIDLAEGKTTPQAKSEKSSILAVTGKAGSGKTVLLANLAHRLADMGLLAITPDWEPRKNRKRRSFAVLAPTNKAASVLRSRGVPATTIHRIIYTPVYDPQFEKLAEWLEGERQSKPVIEGLAPEALDRAMAFFKEQASIPGAFAAAGVRGADFITGWKRRSDPLDIALVDEASMLDRKQLADLGDIFGQIVLFGDPAQLAPIKSKGEMVFDTLAKDDLFALARVHRQSADNPILDLAHMLGDPELSFEHFEDALRACAVRDERIQISQSINADIMTQSPALVWTNKTRKRLIKAYRAAHNAPSNALVPGEPLVCDGLELPLKQRKQRMDLEARGLIKGAQAHYLGPGRKPGFARVNITGTDEPGISVAAIIQIEHPDSDEPLILSAARSGALFLHGAAVTIHKAQGSQWPEVQVYAPDLWVAARTGQHEAGLALWKRLAYVAITRAERRLIWVTRAMLSRPQSPLGDGDGDGDGDGTQ